jgi:hypothetical protein
MGRPYPRHQRGHTLIMVAAVSLPVTLSPSLGLIRGYTNIPRIDLGIAARYEAAKSFDLEDDLEYCPVLTIDEVNPLSPTTATLNPPTVSCIMGLMLTI